MRGTCVNTASAPKAREALSPTVRDRRPPVATERLRRQAHARRCLPALVLRAVDQFDGPGDDVWIEPVRGQLLVRAVMLDVSLEHLIELGVRRQRVLVQLVFAELGARGAVDDGLRD